MENPWKALRYEPPFVLECDKKEIEEFNGEYDDKHPEFIHIDLPPEPYSGNKDAPLVLLRLHPGFDENDRRFMREDKNFRESMRKTRLHESQPYPFYHLNEAYEENPGLSYWKYPLNQVLKEKGYKKCANSIFLLQYFPYKSEKYNKKIDKFLNSQKYSFFLLEAAMHRNAVIVVMDGVDLWKNTIKKLTTYNNIFYCTNNRRPTISKKGFKDSSGNFGFNKILELIP